MIELICYLSLAAAGIGAARGSLIAPGIAVGALMTLLCASYGGAI